MRTNMLHSNLLGRLGNGLLKFVVLVVMACNISGAFAAVNWSTSGTYTGNTTISSSETKTIPENVSIKINGNLTIDGNNIYGGTLNVNGTLRVTGNLTLEKNSTLNMTSGSVLIVEGNIRQKGAALYINVSAFNAKDALIIVQGDYNASGSSLTDGKMLNAKANEVYVFGSSTVSGVSKSDAFYHTYESFETVFLPIELVSFTATATDYGFVFNWVTASEVENDYFTLEYSIDGVDFNEIDYVHGAGTTSETSEYEYRWNEAPEFEVVYFRLKQTDYNGEYSYSDVIVASRKKSSGANGTFRYGPLNLQIQDGELRYIVK